MNRSQSCAVLPGRVKSDLRGQSPQRQRTRKSLRHGRQAGAATKGRLCKSPVRVQKHFQRPNTSPVNTQLMLDRGSSRGGTKGPLSPRWAGASNTRSGHASQTQASKRTEGASHKTLQRSASMGMGVLGQVWQPPRHRILKIGSKSQSVHLQSSPPDNDYWFRTFDKISYRTQPLADIRQKVAFTKSGKATPRVIHDALRQMQRGKRVTPKRFDEFFDKGPLIERSDCGVWYDPHPDNAISSVAKAPPTSGEFEIRPRRKKFPQAPDGNVKRYNGNAAGARKESGIGKRQHDLLRGQLRFRVSEMAPTHNDDVGEPIWKPHSDYTYHESTIMRPEKHSPPVRVRIKTRGGGVRVMHPHANVHAATLDGHPFSSTVPAHAHASHLGDARHGYVPTAPYQVMGRSQIPRVSTVQGATRAMDHTASSHQKLKKTLQRTKSCPSLTAAASASVVRGMKQPGNLTSKSDPGNRPAASPVPPSRAKSPLRHSGTRTHIDLNKRPATVAGSMKPHALARSSYFGRVFAHSYAQRPKTDYCTRKQYDLQLYGNAQQAHGGRAWHKMESDRAMHESTTRSGEGVVLRSKGNPEHGLCYFHE